MAQFTGTIEEFTKFIGGYCRNKVQYISRRHKNMIGKCEACKSRTKKLDAAHVHGKERPIIVADILGNFEENGIVNVDLDIFEEQYLLAHEPIEETIKVLCKACHKKSHSTEKIDEIDEVQEMNEAREIKSIISSNKLSKKRALELVLKKGYNELTNSNTIYSNINTAKDVYWLEPNNNKFSESFYVILNNSLKKQISLFLIPANSIINYSEIFDQRIDRNASKIIINSTSDTFQDKNEFDFVKFLIDTINYS